MLVDSSTMCEVSWFFNCLPSLSDIFPNRMVTQMVNNLPAMRETVFDPWVGKIPWRQEWLPTPVFWP